MTVSTLTISKQIYLPSLVAGLTYDIDTDAAFAYTITDVLQIQTSSGTVTAAVKIAGTAVTGLSSIAVTSTPQNISASGANTVAAGNRVQIVFSSNSGATNINFTLKATRTAVSSVSNSDGTLTISPTSGDVVASLASAPTVTGKMTAASFSPSTTSGVIGTTTNDNAAAGSVGEYISSTVGNGAGVSVTNSTNKDITSISLTAGDWDVWGTIGYNPTSNPVASLLSGWINTTSASAPGAPNGGAFFQDGVINQTNPEGLYPVGLMRLSLSATTTVYLTTYNSFTVGTLKAYEFIGARRVR
jgi:hypothetical protein